MQNLNKKPLDNEGLKLVMACWPCDKWRSAKVDQLTNWVGAISDCLPLSGTNKLPLQLYNFFLYCIVKSVICNFGSKAVPTCIYWLACWCDWNKNNYYTANCLQNENTVSWQKTLELHNANLTAVPCGIVWPQCRGSKLHVNGPAH